MGGWVVEGMMGGDGYEDKGIVMRMIVAMEWMNRYENNDDGWIVEGI